MDKWLRRNIGANYVRVAGVRMASWRGTEFPLLARELPDKEFGTERPKNFREPRDVVRRDVVDFERWEGRGIVTHQQGSCFTRTQPLRLLAKRKLHIIYIQQNRTV